ncbi:MAG: Glycosyl hydrolase, family 18 [Candidatus Daviesbacteria bacterium GW2011_GWA1_41_61]|nr:MAG: Glycosyl hydrolase, family 18 [Candidatus Daviesbacteria bacterium GW2011_GWC1_40_9]KKR92358.1 MAG: Glycosyl hydrolase, family 18 [Candidatus Daviesbacteria bacterium GW2011_GWB1_41_15]KKS14546.1 MAG: Glycosyl hydrolase, family 18 [Candidatus Daviesbacteria bacterium GW2011_GWA1_41_61]
MKDLLPVNLYLAAGLVGLATLMAAFMAALAPSPNIAASLVTMMTPLHPLTEDKSAKEVFGFAPFWTIDKLAGVDFEVLTTLAYFGIPVLGDGNLDRGDPGYTTFKSKKATDIFKRAHVFGTRVVLTLTQMNNGQILALLDNPEAQANATFQAVEEVKKRGIDGINVDFEYNGDPGEDYRQKFTNFVADLADQMHRYNPSSKVTVSVYAASVKDPKIYDITALSSASDGIFMMAYDFALAGSDTAMPTSPLYGYKEGHYWYDVSTAVEDFLSLMPSSKLILGVPWYGYNYVVYQPEIKASTRPSWTWRGRPATQTYAVALENVRPDRADISDFQTGWDDLGQVGWKAYYLPDAGTWRMIFLEDPESLGLKYDFAKNKNLAGVGMWALGFEDGRTELWAVLRDKFGPKVADHSLIGKVIVSDENY